MKNVMLALIAVVCMSGCEAQSTTDPDTNVVAQDPKCLFKTQWGFSRNFTTPYPDNWWFAPPSFNFNTDKDGFISVGIQKGKFRNNQFSQTFEIYFDYQVIKDKLVFKVTKVKKFEAFTKIGEETGADAVSTAKEILKMANVDTQIKFTCEGQKLTFDPIEPITNVPFNVFNWNRTN
jgi:ASC-1-like (ASCH) protein